MAKLNLTCSACGERVYRARVLSNGDTVGYDCRCARTPVAVDYDNPFRSSGELVLDHIHTESGERLRVTSRRQLQEAESKHHFNHVATNMDKANWDSPKQQQTYTVNDLYKRKFSRGQA